MPFLPRQLQVLHRRIRLERLAGVEPAISALADGSVLERFQNLHAVFVAVKGGVFLRNTPLGFMAF
jgi:hypothetical protein